MQRKFPFCVLPIIILGFLADNQTRLSARICPNNPNIAEMVMYDFKPLLH